MISYTNILRATRTAYERGEVLELLKGEDGYDTPVLGVSIDVPTDWTSIIPNGIHALYEENKSDEVIKVYEEAIIKLIHGSSTEIWMAANVIFCQKLNEVEGKSPFILSANIGIEFKKYFNLKKDELIADKSYLGKWSSEKGLYEQIIRINRNLQEKGTSLVR